MNKKEMECQRCEKGKMKIINSFSYFTIAKVYYECNECGHGVELIYPRESLRKLNEKLYIQLWSN